MNSSFLSVSQRDRFEGLLSAKVILVLYSDYSSPDCFQAYRIIKNIQHQLKDKLCLVYRHFSTSAASPLAYRATEAVEAAATQGKFWQMLDCLYAYHSLSDGGDLVCCASWIGLNVEQFLAEMSSDLYFKRIGENCVSGLQHGVSFSPTAFINDIRYQGEWNVEELMEDIAPYL